MNKYVENPSAWTAPVIPEKIPQGDMPGDKIEIGEDHINKANLIFRELLGQIRELKKEDADRKIVLTVCGGSGVGNSETASLLSFSFSILFFISSFFFSSNSFNFCKCLFIIASYSCSFNFSSYIFFNFCFTNVRRTKLNVLLFHCAKLLD